MAMATAARDRLARMLRGDAKSSFSVEVHSLLVYEPNQFLCGTSGFRKERRDGRHPGGDPAIHAGGRGTEAAQVLLDLSREWLGKTIDTEFSRTVTGGSGSPRGRETPGGTR